MGTFGYPLVFTLAEDENRSPWEPLHVERGFSRDASTVTLGITNNWGPAPACFSTPDKDAAQATLEVLCREIAKKVRLVDFPSRGTEADKGTVTIRMSPPLQSAGGCPVFEAGCKDLPVRKRSHSPAGIRVDHAVHDDQAGTRARESASRHLS